MCISVSTHESEWLPFRHNWFVPKSETQLDALLAISENDTTQFTFGHI